MKSIMSVVINIHKVGDGRKGYYISFTPENYLAVKNELSEQGYEINDEYSGIIVVRADKPPNLKFGTVEMSRMHALHHDCH